MQPEDTLMNDNLGIGGQQPYDAIPCQFSAGLTHCSYIFKNSAHINVDSAMFCNASNEGRNG